MSFVCGNLAALAVAAVVSTLGWLYGGMRSAEMISVAPWLIFFLAEVILFFPQKRRGETTYEARKRVWRELKKDPLVWTALGLIALLAIPFANKGLCPSCDFEYIRANNIKGLGLPVPILPFCLDLRDHLVVFLWFAVALSTLIALKHSVTAHGKRMVLKLVVWNGFALALLGFFQIASDAVGPLWQPMQNVAKAGTFFSTFGYPNMAGDYFTTLFGLSLALWRFSNIEEDAVSNTSRAPSEKAKYKIFWRRHLVLVPALAFYFAAISTLSRAAIMLVNVILVVAFTHSLISITHKMSRRKRIRNGMIAMIIVSLVAFFAIATMPEDVHNEVSTLNLSSVADRLSGRGQYHTKVASAIWSDHRIFGCGGWGYKHLCGQKMRELEIDEKEMQIVGGINVHNDYLQFLAEHGIVGFGLMLAIVFMLLVPVVREWIKLVNTAQFTEKKKAPPKPYQIFALPAPVFLMLTTTVATVIHGFGDCPLRSPAVLTLFFVSLGIMPGFLPKDTDHAAR